MGSDNGKKITISDAKLNRFKIFYNCSQWSEPSHIIMRAVRGQWRRQWSFGDEN